MIYKYILPLLLLVSIIISGCSASSHIIVGDLRTPTLPELVVIYSKPPANYEEIAIIDASSKHSWAITDQGRIEVAVKRLKEEAANLGANGILLKGTGDLSAGSGYVTFDGNYAYGYGASAKSAKGIAIYVYDKSLNK